jgi:hypothetical protein
VLGWFLRAYAVGHVERRKVSGERGAIDTVANAYGVPVTTLQNWIRRGPKVWSEAAWRRLIYNARGEADPRSISMIPRATAARFTPDALEEHGALYRRYNQAAGVAPEESDRFFGIQQ